MTRKTNAEIIEEIAREMGEFTIPEMMGKLRERETVTDPPSTRQVSAVIGHADWAEKLPRAEFEQGPNTYRYSPTEPEPQSERAVEAEPVEEELPKPPPLVVAVYAVSEDRYMVEALGGDTAFGTTPGRAMEAYLRIKPQPGTPHARLSRGYASGKMDGITMKDMALRADLHCIDAILRPRDTTMGQEQSMADLAKADEWLELAKSRVSLIRSQMVRARVPARDTPTARPEIQEPTWE